jgi:NH3-dependent NAD+ synthetase
MGVSMPSQFSSGGSVDDSQRLADNLGIDFRIIAISEAHHAYLHMLEPHFAGLEPNVAEENLQARIRRQSVDGHLQQVWPPGALHRQQE